MGISGLLSELHELIVAVGHSLVATTRHGRRPKPCTPTSATFSCGVVPPHRTLLAQSLVLPRRRRLVRRDGSLYCSRGLVLCFSAGSFDSAVRDCLVPFIFGTSIQISRDILSDILQYIPLRHAFTRYRYRCKPHDYLHHSIEICPKVCISTARIATILPPRFVQT